MSHYARGGNPGAVIVGSHVKKTTQQLEVLLQTSGTAGIEVNVSRLANNAGNTSATLLSEILEKVNAAYQSGKTPVVYTSREELTFEDVKTRLQFGEKVSNLLMDIVRGLPSEIGFLISKGGITSNDVLSKGLNLTWARLLGQILPGCSIILTTTQHPQFPNLPVVLFPGNVGDADALSLAYRRLSKQKT